MTDCKRLFFLVAGAGFEPKQSSWLPDPKIASSDCNANQNFGSYWFVAELSRKEFPLRKSVHPGLGHRCISAHRAQFADSAILINDSADVHRSTDRTRRIYNDRDFLGR